MKPFLRYTLILVLIPVMIGLITYCKSSDNMQIEDEYTEIKAKMDKALMSDQPLEAFEKIIPDINKYESVDSAWIAGISVWVKFKKGGKLSWMMDPQDLKKNPKE